MGPTTIRILEDGTHTDNRIGSISLTIAPNTEGPPIHWHRTHDETFLVTKGRVRFFNETGHVDTKAGDYVIVPPKAIHSFANPFDEEAIFFNTFTPAFYVHHLRLMAKATTEAIKEGRNMGKEEALGIMAQFATFPPGSEGHLE